VTSVPASPAAAATAPTAATRVSRPEIVRLMLISHPSRAVAPLITSQNGLLVLNVALKVPRRHHGLFVPL
jgi:hypothetical protein